MLPWLNLATNQDRGTVGRTVPAPVDLASWASAISTIAGHWSTQAGWARALS
jgi:hypothetical protein